MRIEWAGHAARMGKMRNSRILSEKFEGKRPLGRCGCGWENNNKMDLKEIGREDVD
jgi:hypothetical protein